MLYDDIINNSFINLDILITNYCNFNCSYCNVSNDHNYNISQNDIDIIVDNIKYNNDIVYIHLLGGEPTCHPEFELIVNKFLKIGKIVLIYTNLFSIKYNFVNSNVYFIATYHHEKEYSSKYINNIKQLEKLNINVVPQIMYTSDHIYNLDIIKYVDFYLIPLDDKINDTLYRLKFNKMSNNFKNLSLLNLFSQFDKCLVKSYSIKHMKLYIDCKDELIDFKTLKYIKTKEYNCSKCNMNFCSIFNNRINNENS